MHTRHVCSGKSAQIAGSCTSWQVQSRRTQRCPQPAPHPRHTALRGVCCERSLRAQRRVAFSLWPHPVQPARRVWPERGPHPRGLWSDKEVGAARLGTLPAGALGTSYHALWRCGFEVVACATRHPSWLQYRQVSRRVLPWRRPAAPPSAGAALLLASHLHDQSRRGPSSLCSLGTRRGGGVCRRGKAALDRVQLEPAGGRPRHGKAEGVGRCRLVFLFRFNRSCRLSSKMERNRERTYPRFPAHGGARGAQFQSRDSPNSQSFG